MAVTQEEVDLLQWFHSIDFGNGVVSRGAKSLSLLARQADVAFKHGVAGKSVLDIGTWDGAMSFEAERRGASRVLATDSFAWARSGMNRKPSFDLAKRYLGARVDEKVIDVFELTPQNVGTFDVVLFLGVLYHLKEPLRGLEHVAPLTHDLLVVDTETMLDTMDSPVMTFFPGRELNNDPTNWWAPNIKCVLSMLNVAGFRKVEYTNNPVWSGPVNDKKGRYVFHAWK